VIRKAGEAAQPSATATHRRNGKGTRVNIHYTKECVGKRGTTSYNNLNITHVNSQIRTRCKIANYKPYESNRAVCATKTTKLCTEKITWTTSIEGSPFFFSGKSILPQLQQKFLAFYVVPTFINVPSRTRHLVPILSQINPVHAPHHPAS